jgi:Raf kinase inhibitor-like YbhB/YbcL family protein
MRKFTPVLALMNVLVSGAVMAADFTVTSPQVKENGRIAADQVFNGMGCQGSNISPALQWQGAPKETRSFAVTIYDPDAPTGSGWWHWVLFNIPANVNRLEKNAGNPQAGLTPRGSIQSRTDFGKPGYGGPCPPPGDKPHHYQITVYALKTESLPLDENATAAQVGFQLQQNALGKAMITGLYSR